MHSSSIMQDVSLATSGSIAWQQGAVVASYVGERDKERQREIDKEREWKKKTS